ncbi:MAG: hypothetical protein RQ899_06010 [Pseudomonadales bacterium]|nr:hypothetical protein [Pseudomonadales bacterium]
MRAVEEGNQAAWGVLHEKHKHYALSLASDRIKDGSRAEDLGNL